MHSVSTGKRAKITLEIFQFSFSEPVQLDVITGIVSHNIFKVFVTYSPITILVNLPEKKKKKKDLSMFKLAFGDIKSVFLYPFIFDTKKNP